ncbi:MAG: lysylphosphatidylglycerol synthase transmembrane domain-containing protein [Thermodesulfobacteriota bacterium]
MSKLVVRVLKVAAAAVIYYLLYHYGLFSLDILKSIASDPWFLTMGGLAIFATVPLGSLRWWQFLDTQGLRMGFFRVFGIFYLGFFANTLLLGAIGGDVVRAAVVCQDSQGSRMPALSTILLDRVCGLYAIICVGALSGLLLPQESFGHPLINALRSFVLVAFGVVTAATAAALVFAARLVAWGQARRVEGKNFILAKLLDLLAAIASFRKAPGRLGFGFAVSIIIQLLTVLTVFLACWIGGHSQLGYWDCAFATSMAMLASIIPLTPGGMGIGEAAFTQVCLLIVASQSSQGITDAFVAFRVVGLLVALPGLLFYSIMGRKTA